MALIRTWYCWNGTRPVTVVCTADGSSTVCWSFHSGSNWGQIWLPSNSTSTRYPVSGRFPLKVGGVQPRMRVWLVTMVTMGAAGADGAVGGSKVEWNHYRVVWNGDQRTSDTNSNGSNNLLQRLTSDPCHRYLYDTLVSTSVLFVHVP